MVLYVLHYTIIDFNEIDMRICLPEKVIIHRGYAVVMVGSI